MASMLDFAPGGRFHYSGQYDAPPPWKKKKSSLFWEDQLQRQSEIRDDPSSNLGFFGLNYSDMPAAIQYPMEWIKKQVLQGEARDARYSKNIAETVSGLGESISEREARLLQERKDEAAKEQALVQERRRMPTTVDKSAIAQKGGDNNDMLRYLLLMNFLQNIAYQSAAPDVRPGYGTSAGTSRAFPTMPKM